MIIQLSTCFSITLLDPLHSFLFFLWDFLPLRKENNFISTFLCFLGSSTPGVCELRAMCPIESVCVH
jgi:hypothetical protein